MIPRLSTGGPGRLVLIWILALWAVALSLESLFRRGGFASEQGLPQRLERQGSLYLRSPVTTSDKPPPEGVVVLEAADYVKASPGVPSAAIRLRRVSLLRSTQALSLPVERLGPALLGAGGKGRCVVIDRRGAILMELPTSEAWLSWRDSQRPGTAETLAWLGGLRPRRVNGCLWESLPS